VQARRSDGPAVGRRPGGVFVSDNTLRDGEQAAGVAFSREEKLAIARAVAALGVDMISAGFPAVSEDEASICRAIVEADLPCAVRVFSRLRRSDLDLAISIGAPVVSVWAPISDLHITRKLKTTEEELFRSAIEAIEHIAAKGRKARFGLEDASRAPLERVIRFARAAEAAGAAWVGLSDTCGVLTPTEAARLVAAVRGEIRTSLIVHFHNDLGLATATSLAALESGADGIDGTFTGTGERAGNLRLEEILVVLAARYDAGLRVDLRGLAGVVELVSRATRRPVPVDQPMFGEHAFTHESGIHVAGILEDPAMYEPFPPSLIGRAHRIAWGKHSGLKGVQHLLRQHGVELSAEREAELLAAVKRHGQQKQRVTDDDVLRWARELAVAGGR
jgi:isopropylmalate/homocitrate/citramalate synthase